jgi:hypothetical protein
MYLTTVDTNFREDQVNDRLRFGHPVKDEYLDRQRGRLAFRPGQVFGFVWWRSNDWGTTTWAVAVLEAVRPPAEGYAVPSVVPGAQVHLWAAGRGKETPGPVERALLFLDCLENLDYDLALLDPAYYRAAALSLRFRQLPRLLTPAEYRRMTRHARPAAA